MKKIIFALLLTITFNTLHAQYDDNTYPYFSSGRKTDFFTQLSFGNFVPLSLQPAIGNHPLAGFAIGSPIDKSSELLFDFEYRLGMAQNSYLVNVDNKVFSVNVPPQIYFGMSYNRFILQNYREKIKLLAGLGFQELSFNDTCGCSHSVQTFVASTGIENDFYLTNSTYLGLRTRYQYEFEDWDGHPSLAGGTVMLDCTLGMMYAQTNKRHHGHHGHGGHGGGHGHSGGHGGHC